jgi:hypothetical protein
MNNKDTTLQVGVTPFEILGNFIAVVSVIGHHEQNGFFPQLLVFGV